VARQELGDEIGERMRVLVDTVKGLLLLGSAQVSEARARGVDEHEVAHIEQAVLIVDHAVWRSGRVRVVGGAHTLRAESAHVQPHRR